MSEEAEELDGIHLQKTNSQDITRQQLPGGACFLSSISFGPTITWYLLDTEIFCVEPWGPTRTSDDSIHNLRPTLDFNKLLK